MMGLRIKGLAAAVESALGSESLVDDPESFRDDGRPAEDVDAPGSIDECAELLKLAAREGWAVVPAGQGSWLSVGNPVRRADLVVTTRRLDRLRDHQPDDLLATVEAGASLDSLREALGRERQWWPLDPPGGGTVGATIATGSAGPLAAAYGTPRDLVLGLTAVLADGRIVKAGGRVVKNVAGYDMVKLFTGSWGTLGLITEAHLRLHPTPESDRTRVYFADRVEALTALAADLGRTRSLPPAAAEILAPAAAGALGLEAGEWLMAVRWLGHASAVEDAVATAEGVAAPLALAGEDRSGTLWDKLAAIEESVVPALAVRATVPLRSSGTMIGLARTLGSGQTPALVASPLLGRIWILVSEALYNAGSGSRVWASRIEALRRAARQRGGDVRVERMPQDLRGAVDPWGDPGTSLRLHHGLKAKFDPNGILNPGRFVGGL